LFGYIKEVKILYEIVWFLLAFTATLIFVVITKFFDLSITVGEAVLVGLLLLLISGIATAFLPIEE